MNTESLLRLCCIKFGHTCFRVWLGVPQEMRAILLDCDTCRACLIDRPPIETWLESVVKQWFKISTYIPCEPRVRTSSISDRRPGSPFHFFKAASSDSLCRTYCHISLSTSEFLKATMTASSASPSTAISMSRSNRLATTIWVFFKFQRAMVAKMPMSSSR